MENVQAKISALKEHQKKTIISALKQAYQQLKTPILYLEARANGIVTSFLNQSDVLSSGFSKIVTLKDVPEEGFTRVVIVTVMADTARSQIEQISHLIEETYLINLSVSGRQMKEVLRLSPLRPKLKGLIEISLNFFPFIDSVYVGHIQLQTQTKSPSFQESLTSLLISFPKYHEFRISTIGSSFSSLGISVKKNLEEKLLVIQSHKNKQYNLNGSPKIKLLILERKIDQMSPLVYNYYFGPISKQISVFDKINTQFTSDSAIYTALFPLDIEQASQLLESITSEKAENQKMKFELHQFEKAKKAITKHYDEHSSPQQIAIQLQALSSIKHFCQRRAFATTLEQTIINGKSEGDEKMTTGMVVDRIVEWSTIPMQEYKPSEQDYIKILILAYMVNSFWFWQRKIINAGLKGDNKQKVLDFCKKVEGKFKCLAEKPQSQDRLDLYRHQPLLVETSRKWIIKDPNQACSEIIINQSLVNKQSVQIIAIKGPLGYGQLALLIRQTKKADPKGQFIFFCQSLVTTKEYMNFILKGSKKQ